MYPIIHSIVHCFFFFNDTATTEIYTLSLHDALPIFEVLLDLATRVGQEGPVRADGRAVLAGRGDVVRRDRHDAGIGDRELGDRKSTRLNSSHANISYAVFCLKKKKKQKRIIPIVDVI